MKKALAGFFYQKLFLFLHRIDEYVLPTRARGQPFIERRVVPIPSPDKLLHQCLVSKVQRLLFPYPSKCLGMPGVSARALVLGQDIPQAM